MPEKTIKTLETERLVLRQLQLEDAPTVYKKWTSDDDVARYVRWNTHKSVEETIEYINKTIENCKNENNYEWGIVLKEENELIGAIGAFPSEEGRIELGYNIAKKYWRNGYTTEALKRVMDYLINEENIHHFRCAHAALNPASGAVMQKVGFKYAKNEIKDKFDGSEKFDCKVYYLDV